MFLKNFRDAAEERDGMIGRGRGTFFDWDNSGGFKGSGEDTSRY